MIDYTAILKILPIFMLALMSPGPDFVIVSSMSLSRGRIDGIKAAAGIATIIFLYTTLSLAGLSALFTHYAKITIAIKLCGGLYLLYLACLMWRSSFAKPGHIRQAIESPRKKDAYALGVLTCLTNLKAIAFFASIFTLALTPDTSLATKTAIAIMMPVMTFCWFSFVAYGLSKKKVRERYRNCQHIIDRVTGALLGLCGIRLVLSATE